MTTFRRFRNGMLKNAVDSVLSQEFEDFELVICDDASFDGTEDYLREVANSDPRVKVIRNETNVNSVAISLGRCMLASNQNAPLIAWMFDDCVLRADALLILFNELHKHNSDMVFGVTRVVLASGKDLMVGGHDIPFIRRHIEKNPTLVPNAGVLIRREVFDRVGWYDNSIVMRRSCDWELFIRIFQECPRISKVDDILCNEFGDQQPDSLRNSFFTALDLMSSYIRRRNSNGFRLDVRTVIDQPVDWLPAGDWSPEELRLAYYMFTEYFLSIGNFDKASEWAEKLNAGNDLMPFFVETLRHISSSGDTVQAGQARAAATAMLYYHVRAELNPRRRPEVRSTMLVRAMYDDLVAAEDEIRDLMTQKANALEEKSHQRTLATALLSLVNLLSAGRGAGHIDDVKRVSDDSQVIVGWGTANLGRNPANMRVLVTCGSDIIGQSRLTIDRSDILIVHPGLASIRLGFEVHVPIVNSDNPTRVLVFDDQDVQILDHAATEQREA